MRGMLGVAAAALFALVALTTTAQHRSVALLQAKQDPMGNYINGAERQLYYLQRSLPVGAVARKYPTEEGELKQLFQHSEKGLQALAMQQAKLKEAEKKKSPSTKLAQKKDLQKLVNEAGSMMATLEKQLPAADKKAFPKEAGELHAAFHSELSHLEGIDKQLSKEARKRAPTTTLRSIATPSKQSMAAQAALDNDVEKDRKENQALSKQADVDHVMSTLNAPIKPDPKGRLPAKKPSKAAARPQALAENAGALTSSGVERWGTVFEPNLASAGAAGMRGQDVMYAPAQKEYAKYENTVSKWLNVKDPAAPTPHGTNWWEDKSKANDQWWTHNHAGRGY